MGAIPGVADLLAKAPLFGALDPEVLARVALEMRERNFEPGHLIFARGDPGHSIYLVADGRVRLSINSADGRALAFAHACSGDIFGEIAALDGGPRSADATALTAVRVLVLSQASLKQLMAGNPLIAEAMIAFLCKRMRVTSDKFEDVAFNPIEQRLARFLLHVVKMRQQLDSAAHGAFEIGMSQSELALLIGTSRQTVNSALTALEKCGAVKRCGALLEYDLERLTRAAALE
jgi:CRP/FNR family transcriptional regulator, cyclic AMP receptor protein